MTPLFLVLTLLAWGQDVVHTEDTGRRRRYDGLAGMGPLGELGQWEYTARYEYVLEGVPQYLGRFDDDSEVDQFVHMLGVSRVLRQPEGAKDVARVMWANRGACMVAPGREPDCMVSTGTPLHPRDGVRGVYFMSTVKPESVPPGLQRAVETVPLVVSHHRFYEQVTPYGSVCEVEGGALREKFGRVLWIDEGGVVKGVRGTRRDRDAVRRHMAEVGADAWVRDNAGEVLGLKYDVVVERILGAVAK